jgi:hypothetical protein
VFDILSSLLPVLASALAPVVTEGVKSVADVLGKKVPKMLKAPLSIVFGAAISALLGGDPTVGAAVGGAGAVGFKVGKTS